jgi:acyl carrier protein
MIRHQAEVEVRAILQTVLGREIGPGENVSRQTETTWDSLRHIEILLAIEGACGVRFDEEEMGLLDSLDKLAASVEHHRAT